MPDQVYFNDANRMLELDQLNQDKSINLNACFFILTIGVTLTLRTYP
jgi:hypothetical protein